MSRRPMKIFMGLTEVAGYYGKLKKGFEGLGVECVLIELAPHPSSYTGIDDAGGLVKLIRACHKKLSLITESSIFTRSLWWRVHQILVLILFCGALIKYDVFIFSYASTFYYYRELPILKLLRKKIIYAFHGDDSRPPYLSGLYNGSMSSSQVKGIIELTKTQKETLGKIERYADLIISHPPSSQLHEKPIVSFLLIGIPCSCNDDQIDRNKKRSD